MLGDEGLSREDAIERLAEYLFAKIERMDPSEMGSWADIDETVRESYRASIREILLEKTLLNFAMGVSNDSPTTT